MNELHSQTPCRPGSILAMLLLAVASLWTGTLPGQDQPATAVESPSAAAHLELVKTLANDEYQARQQAMAQLQKIGSAAQQALRQGLTHDDPHVRRRCRQLLSDIVAGEYHRRIDQVAQADPAKQRTLLKLLPGWARFAEMVGTDQVARRLFLQMQREEAGLFAALEDSPQAAADAVATRFKQIQARTYTGLVAQRKTPSWASMSSLVFVASDRNVGVNQLLLDNYAWYGLLQQNSLRQALTDKQQQATACAVLGLWISTPGSAAIAYNKLRLGIRYHVPDTLSLALIGLQQRIDGNSSFNSFSMQVVGSMGGAVYSRALADCLDWDQVVSRRSLMIDGKQVVIDVLLQDVALAWLIYTTDQEHADYFMPAAKNAFRRLQQSPSNTVSGSLMYFNRPGRRKEALQKWHAYVAQNPLPELPDELIVQTPAEARGGPRKGAVEEILERFKQSIPSSLNPSREPSPEPAIEELPLASTGSHNRPLPQILPTQKQPANPKQPLEPGSASGLPVADRDITRQLLLARKAIERDELADAVLLLGRLLSEQTDYTFRENRLVPVSQGLKAEAERQLAALPLRGQDLYEDHFGSEAERQLQQAIESGEPQQLVITSARFFHTRAGAEATLLLGNRLLRENRPLETAILLERLVDRSRHAASFQPELNLQLAIAWSLAGVPLRAEAILAELKKQAPNITVQAGDQQISLFGDDADPLQRLATFAGSTDSALQPGDWFMFRGNRQRNQLAADDGPYLVAQPLLQSTQAAWLGKQTRELEIEYRSRHQSVIPSLQPLVVGDTILVRTATHLSALSASDGQLRWQTTIMDDLYRLADESLDSWDEVDQAMIRRGLELRLWNNPTFGTISSDGHSVFGVEGLGFSEVPLRQHLVVAADGSRRLESGMLKTYNQLTAHDIQTGKTRWEIGGPVNSGVAQEGYFFLGPPLPLGDRLFVIARRGNQVVLMELQASDGQQVWEKVVAAQQQPVLPVRSNGVPPIWSALAETWRSGGSPSYSQGVLVCPLSDRQLAAVDLTSRSILWIYTQQSTEGPINSQMQQLRLMAIQSDVHAPLDSWAENSPTIVADRVLITPAGSGRLFCLDLASGRVQWSQDRKDSWYVAGVSDDVIFLVGHRGVRALRLADGEAAWPTPHAAFPPGSMPSGRGYLASGMLYVPLSSAEVVGFDTSSGRLASRSRSLAGDIPGNLIPMGDHLLSQSATQLVSFQLLEQRLQANDKQLQERPDDSTLLINRAELNLFRGRVKQAVDQLRDVLERGADARASRLLSLALVDGLHADFDSFRPLVEELLPELEKSRADASFLKELVQVYQKGGDALGAVEACLELASRSDELDKMEHADGVRQVRRDRWIQARLKIIWESASPADRQRIHQRLVEFIDTTEHADRLLAGLPIVHQVWLEQAPILIANKEYDLAEHILRRVLVAGSDEQQRAAVVRLAEVYQANQEHRRAAGVYHLLATDLADQVCLAGMTGAEISNQRPADDPSRNLSPADPLASTWKKTPPHAREVRSNNSGTYRYPLQLLGDQHQFLSPLRLEIDSRARVVSALDMIGRAQWNADSGSDDSSIPYRGPSYHRMLGCRLGSMTYIWTGDRICALAAHEQGASVKWTANSWRDRNSWQMRWAANRFGFQPFKNMARPQRAGFAIPMHVTADVICFQQSRELRAVDSFSGELIWLRRNLPLGCDLLGDGQRIMVTASDSQDALVLRLSDGEEIGRRHVLPLEQRMAVEGLSSLNWLADKNQATLTRTDHWTQQQLWQHNYPAGTMSWMVDQQRVAIIQASGLVRILDALSGNLIVEAEVPVPEKMFAAAVFASSGHYFVTTQKEDGNPIQIMNPTLASAVPVNGPVSCFADDSGRLVWSEEVELQTLRSDRSSHLPLLVFFNQRRHTQPNGSSSYMVSLICMDKFTGKRILEQRRPYGDVVFEVRGNPAEQRVEVVMRSATLRVYFSEQPPALMEGENPVLPNDPDKVPAQPAATEPGPADKLRALFQRLERGLEKQLR
jgi:outer membrane protein assembly factor BamB